VLSEILHNEGYRTRGYSANPYISSHFNFDRGFTDFHTTWKLDLLSSNLFDWETFATEHKSDGSSRYLRGLIECIQSDTKTLPSIKRGVEIKLRDLGFGIGPRDDGASEIQEFVEQATFGNDEFLFLNLMEAHEPYTSPNVRGKSQADMQTTVELTFRDHEQNKDAVRDAYDDAVAYLSDVYRDIFDSLRNSFDLIITCGDHGELFDKRGVWGHFYGVDPELTNVPLHIYRNEDTTTECSQAVSLLDVYTTILESAGVDKHCGRGINILIDGASSEPRLAECRGISEKRIDQIRYDGEATKRTQEFEQELFGAVIPPESYGYEHIEGFSVQGDVTRKEAESTIDKLIKRLEVDYSEADSIESDVQNHLEDLGYV
jgi:arylsulfatase A-like enzyme